MVPYFLRFFQMHNSMQLFFKDTHNHIYYNISYQNFTQV